MPGISAAPRLGAVEVPSLRTAETGLPVQPLTTAPTLDPAVVPAAPLAQPLDPALPPRPAAPPAIDERRISEERDPEPAAVELRAILRDDGSPDPWRMDGAFDGGPAGAVEAEPAAPEPEPDARDVSAEYNGLRAALKKIRRRSGFAPRSTELAALKQYKVLFVPGFLSGAFIKLAKATGRDARPWHYFGSQISWLSSLRVEHELVPVHTEQTVEHNSRLVAEAIRSSAKPVIIISHSKGGLDTLEALQGLKDEELQKVAGWLPVQTPFLGSPGADRVIDQPLVHFWVSRFLEHPTVGGSRASLERMATQTSERYYEERRHRIARVLSRVPTIAFTSWKQIGFMELLGELSRVGARLNPFLNPWLLWSPLLGLVVILKGVAGSLTWLAHKSDGLVPALRARLPEMEFVEEEGVDHFAPFVDHGGKFDRLEFTQALLKMLLRRMRVRARPGA